MNHTWLAGQLDYILLWHGLALVLLAGVCLKLSPARPQMPWRWLGLFGLMHAAGLWVGMTAPSFPDTAAWRIARASIMAGSYLALLEFGRQGWWKQRGWGAGAMDSSGLRVAGNGDQASRRWQRGAGMRRRSWTARRPG